MDLKALDDEFLSEGYKEKKACEVAAAIADQPAGSAAETASPRVITTEEDIADALAAPPVQTITSTVEAPAVDAGESDATSASHTATFGSGAQAPDAAEVDATLTAQTAALAESVAGAHAKPASEVIAPMLEALPGVSAHARVAAALTGQKMHLHHHIQIRFDEI